MSRRAITLCGIVILLALLSAFADGRERAGAAVTAATTGAKCATCAAYGPRDPRCDIPNL